MALTGLDVHALLRARGHAVAAPPKLHPMAYGELFMYLRSRDISKYIGVRAWLLAYSEASGDHNPMDGSILLPAGHKYFYRSAMCTAWRKLDYNEKDIPKLSLFLEVWRLELPWVRVRQSHSPFTKCGLCEFLKALAESSSDHSVRAQVIARLGQHYEFATTQRLVISYLWRRSEADPGSFAS